MSVQSNEQFLSDWQAHAPPAAARPRPTRLDLSRVNPLIWHDTMRTRVTEMFLSCCMTGIGLVLMLPGETTSFPQYTDIKHWIEFFPGTELRYGALIALVGVMRLVALFINGNYHRTPLIRFLGCVVGSMLWGSLLISVFDTPNMEAVPLILVFLSFGVMFEVVSGGRAAVDALRMKSFFAAVRPGPRDVRGV